jgi:hypothetical protein
MRNLLSQDFFMFARALLIVLLTFLAPLAAAQSDQRGDESTAVRETVTKAERVAIQRVIVDQIKAFQREDDLAAFSLAAPDVRRQYGSAQAFVTMVKLGYEPIFHNRSAMFLEAAVVDGNVIQAMRIVQSDGDVVIALFNMERQANGDWRIAGCEIAPSDLIAT